MVDVVQLILGTLILWAPGITWTWALVDGLDWAKFLAVSVIVALTIQPGTVYVLNVFLGVPITAMNAALISLGLASLGLAWALREPVARAMA